MKKCIGTTIVGLLSMISNINYAIPPGLANCGASCFLNASVQVLYHITPLTNLLLGKSNIYPAKSIASLYVKLINEFYKVRTTSTIFSCKRDKNPNTLGQFVNKSYELLGEGLNCNNQEDAIEFIEQLMNQLFEQSQDPQIREGLNNLFNVNLQTTLQCPNQTPRVSEQKNHFILQLPVLNQKNNKPLQSLDQCIEEFFAPETVEYEGQRCTKQFQLINTGQFLIIGLKRFTSQLTKLYHRVTIPVQLQLKPTWFNTPAEHQNEHYHLIGAIIHGGGYAGGHYWAYVQENNQWYKCNDRNITRVNIDNTQVLTEMQGSKTGQPTGYLFVYRKEAAPPLVPPRQPSATNALQESLQKLQHNLTILHTMLKTLS